MSKEGTYFIITDELLQATYRNKLEQTIESLVDMCRYKQKEYVEGNSKQSGGDYLRELLNTEVITVKMYLNILPVVVNYNTPYELKINNHDN